MTTSETGLTAADPEALADFRRANFIGRIEVVLGHDLAHVAASGLWMTCQEQWVAAGALVSLTRLLEEIQGNDEYVRVVQEAVLAADGYAGGVGVVSDATVLGGLYGAGIAQLPATKLELPVLFGLPPSAGWIDDPICAANGNFFHGDEDAHLPGFARALSVVRCYNAMSAVVGAFGSGWTSILDVRVVVDSDALARVWLADGAVIPFEVNADGSWTAQVRPRLALERIDTGWLLHDGPYDRWTFDADGVLTGSTGRGYAVGVERDEDVTLRESCSGRWVTYERADGRVRGVETSDGRRCTYSYDGDGHLVRVDRAIGALAYEVIGGLVVAITDADGVETFRNTYDDRRRVVRQRSPHGRESTYGYTDHGTTIVGDTDDGPKNIFVHDGRGNVTAVVDGNGRAMRFTYDAHDRMRARVDRMGARWAYDYDDAGNLIEQHDPDGLAQRWEYDDLQRTVSETDRAGNTTLFEYGDGRTPSVITGPDGAVIRTVTDNRDRPVSITDPDGFTTRYEWNADGLASAIVNALDHRSSFDYDSAGRLVAVVDSAGRRTDFVLDGTGLPVTVETPIGVERYSYSPAGRANTGVDAGGVSWSATYDRAGALHTFVDAAGSTVRFERDTHGNVATVVAPDGAQYTHEYDAVCRLVAASDPTGRRTERGYDAEGRSIAVTWADGSSWHRTVDEFGLSLTITGPDGAQTTREYHPNMELASVVDAAGNRFGYEIDAYGRVTAAADPDGGRTEVTYSPAGRVRQVRSPMGRTQTYEYDAAGRLIATLGPDGIRTDFELGPDGRLGAVRHGDDEVRVEYDAAGRPVNWSSDRSQLGFEWDAGRLAGIASPGTNPARFSWDPRGLLERAVDPAGVATEFGYDVRGRVTASVTGEHRELISYDATGLVDAVVDGLGRAVAVTRDRGGRPIETRWADGSAVHVAYDAAGRAERITNASATELARFRYDLLGRVVDAQAGATTVAFSRDPLGRVVSAESPTGTIVYERDADGLIASRIDGAAATTFVRNDGGTLTGFDDTEAGRVDLPDLDRAADRDASGRVVADRDGRLYRYDDAGRIAETVTAT
ncbi:MAG: DUF6531 domain-containing protein, partial [Actinomycetota bacterium]|nr:DUF6531 domain-containing protein [Actinomycetota bacterium]